MNLNTTIINNIIVTFRDYSQPNVLISHSVTAAAKKFDCYRLILYAYICQYPNNKLLSVSLFITLYGFMTLGIMSVRVVLCEVI